MSLLVPKHRTTSIPLAFLVRCPQSDQSLQDLGSSSTSSWAPRLAASLIDLHLQNNHYQTATSGNVNHGHKLWLSMLPDPDLLLQASLPVHGDDDMIQSTQCTALELAGELLAYFARDIFSISPATCVTICSFLEPTVFIQLFVGFLGIMHIYHCFLRFRWNLLLVLQPSISSFLMRLWTHYSAFSAPDAASSESMMRKKP
jgi:hypothetical protein